jgi:hypothetical protein
MLHRATRRARAKVRLTYGSTPATYLVRAYGAWTTLAEIGRGLLFRAVNRLGRTGDDPLSDNPVARIVMRRLEAVGVDPAGYVGHSLRAALTTSAS